MRGNWVMIFCVVFKFRHYSTQKATFVSITATTHCGKWLFKRFSINHTMEKINLSTSKHSSALSFRTQFLACVRKFPVFTTFEQVKECWIYICGWNVLLAGGLCDQMTCNLKENLLFFRIIVKRFAGNIKRSSSVVFDGFFKAEIFL